MKDRDGPRPASLRGMSSHTAALATLASLLALLCPATLRAQSVSEVSGRYGCSTQGVERLAAQLVETQICMDPDRFVRASPHRGISLTSSRVRPLMSRSARDAEIVQSTGDVHG